MHSRPTFSLAFLPDGRRARAVDSAIRVALIESVGLVLETAAREGLPYTGDYARWASTVSSMERAPPELWACYHDLVQAGLTGDADTFERTAAELLTTPWFAAHHLRVETLDGEQLGETTIARLSRLIDDDPATPLGLTRVAAEEVERVRDLFAASRPLVGEMAPDLLAELDVLAHLVLLARGGKGNAAFGGAATIFLWGAVVLNPDQLPGRVALVEALAHETAHALLFGLTLGENLTSNDPAERYSSPLRADRRPIEGVVHATYVLARMVHALDRLGSSPMLSGEERRILDAKRAKSVHLFRDSAEVVRSAARFTSPGKAIFEDCVAAMEARDSRPV